MFWAQKFQIIKRNNKKFYYYCNLVTQIEGGM